MEAAAHRECEKKSKRIEGRKVFNYQRYMTAAAPTGEESFPFSQDIHHHSST